MLHQTNINVATYKALSLSFKREILKSSGWFVRSRSFLSVARFWVNRVVTSRQLLDHSKRESWRYLTLPYTCKSTWNEVLVIIRLRLLQLRLMLTRRWLGLELWTAALLYLAMGVFESDCNLDNRIECHVIWVTGIGYWVLSIAVKEDLPNVRLRALSLIQKSAKRSHFCPEANNSSLRFFQLHQRWECSNRKCACFLQPSCVNVEMKRTCVQHDVRLVILRIAF